MNGGLRVLVSSVPAPGHLLPLLPVCRALADAGDHVLVVGPASTVHAAGQAGLTAMERGTEIGEWFAALAARTRGEPGEGLAPERVLGYFVPRLFGEIGAAAMIDMLMETIDAFHPDVVYYDSMNFGAPLALACAGLPGVHHSQSLLPEPGLFELCADAVSSLWCAFGKQPPARCGLFDGTTISNWPASLDTCSDHYGVVRRIGPHPPMCSRSDDLDQWFAACRNRPLVYATLGTTTNADLSVLRAVIDGLADEHVNIVVTVGRNNDPAAVGTAPDNVHIARFIPQEGLLPHCDLVVSHGGSGTVLGALAHGLPQLIVPQGADQFINAGCVARHGLGRCIDSLSASPDDIRRHVLDLLDTMECRRAVAAVRDELADTPGVDEVVECIHQMVR